MESGNRRTGCSIASALLRVTRSSETMWLFDRIRPVTPGDDRLVGDGSRPTSACCCAQHAIVEYWRCDALGLQSEFTAACR